VGAGEMDTTWIGFLSPSAFCGVFSFSDFVAGATWSATGAKSFDFFAWLGRVLATLVLIVPLSGSQPIAPKIPTANRVDAHRTNIRTSTHNRVRGSVSLRP